LNSENEIDTQKKAEVEIGLTKSQVKKPIPFSQLDIGTEPFYNGSEHLQSLQNLAHNVLVNRTYNSTGLVLLVLDMIDKLKAFPRTLRKLEQLLKVL